MAKIKFGEGGLQLEAKLPENKEVPQKEVIQPTKGVDIAEIAAQAAEIMAIPKAESVDLGPVMKRLNDLDARLDSHSKQQTIHTAKLLHHDDENELLHQKLDDIDHKLVEEDCCQPTAHDNTHVAESLQTMSNRLLAKDARIKDVERKLQLKLDKQTKINIALGLGLMISLLINFI